MTKSTTVIAVLILILTLTPTYNDSATCHHNCKVTPSGRTFIENFEGQVDYVYKDIAGHETVCFGHLVKPGEHFGLMTPNQCGKILQSDLKPVERAINISAKRPLKMNESDALADLFYNEGTADKNNLWARVNKYNDPKFELYDLVKIDNQWHVVKSIFNRRKAEEQLFNL